jgi:hypothetical protein
MLAVHGKIMTAKDFILSEGKGIATEMRKASVKVSLLKPHERTDSENLRKIHSEVTSANAVYPLLVDGKTLVVLDGHHRLACLRKLKVNRAPVILVDYFSDDVDVGSWRPKRKVTKEEVIRRGLSGKLFLPKTSRHTHRFRTKRPVAFEIKAGAKRKCREPGSKRPENKKK